MPREFRSTSCRACGEPTVAPRPYCSVTCANIGRLGPTVAVLPVLDTGALSDLELGRAAEFLVCADLILAGFPAYPSAAGLPYDVVVDLGHRLIKLQVKSTRGPRAVPQRKVYTPAYYFQTRRCGVGGRRTYDAGAFDAYALVALDTRQIAYLAHDAHRHQSIALRPAGYANTHGSRTQRTIADFPWADVVSGLL